MTRDRCIRVRVSPTEKALTEQVARAQRVGISEVIRLVLRREGKRLGLWPPDQTTGLQTAEGGQQVDEADVHVG